MSGSRELTELEKLYSGGYLAGENEFQDLFGNPILPLIPVRKANRQWFALLSPNLEIDIFSPKVLKGKQLLCQQEEAKEYYYKDGTHAQQRGFEASHKWAAKKRKATNQPRSSSSLYSNLDKEMDRLKRNKDLYFEKANAVIRALHHGKDAAVTRQQQKPVVPQKEYDINGFFNEEYFAEKENTPENVNAGVSACPGLTLFSPQFKEKTHAGTFTMSPEASPSR